MRMELGLQIACTVRSEVPSAVMKMMVPRVAGLACLISPGSRCDSSRILNEKALHRHLNN